MTAGMTIARVFKPIGKAKYFIAKHAPKILLGLGIAGYGVTVVAATKAAEKAQNVRDEFLNDHDKKKFIKGYAKTWAPTVGLFAASTACVTGGHIILHGRYVAAGVALKATQKAFRQYRDRVVAKEGKEADICYRHGLTDTVSLIDGEDGSQETVHVLDPKAEVDPSDYYIYKVDSRNALWDNDPRVLIKALRTALGYLNDRLVASYDGRVTLKDALMDSGFGYTLQDEKLAKFAGRAGWNMNSDRGDGYISFGPMFDAILEDPRDFERGRIPWIIIEFNCDGDIYGD